MDCIRSHCGVDNMNYEDIREKVLEELQFHQREVIGYMQSVEYFRERAEIWMRMNVGDTPMGKTGHRPYEVFSKFFDSQIDSLLPESDRYSFNVNVSRVDDCIDVTIYVQYDDYVLANMI